MSRYRNLQALLITYTFPPANGTSWRTFHLFSSLSSFIEKVDVISTKNNFSNINEAPALAKLTQVHRVGTLDYRTFRLNKGNGQYAVNESAKSNTKLRFYNLINSFPFNIFLSEGGLIYTILGLKKALELTPKHQQTLVFSSFRPYADHIIAFLLRLFRPHIFWVADFRDLHIDPRLNETYFPRVQSWFNRRILANADVVTTVSKGLAKHLKPFHHNVVVLRNGIGELSARPTTQASSDSPFFTITYTGSMFRDLRQPHLLLEALSELIAEQKIDSKNCRIKYAGKDTATWLPLLEKFGLTELFESLGSVSHEQALQLQTNAHINLLLTYSSPQLTGNATGKLYEYLAARRPVLLLVNGSRDEELEEIFEETSAGLIAYNSLNHKDLVKTYLLGKYLEWKSTGQVSPTISEAQLASYKWENMVHEFLAKHYFQPSQTAQQLA